MHLVWTAISVHKEAIYKAIDSSAFIIRVAKKRIISKNESTEIAVEQS